MIGESKGIPSILVDAQIRSVRTERVDVDPLKITNVLFHKWRSGLVDLDRDAEYINKDGVWESWEDTGHGSGLTRTYRAATPEEIVMNSSFDNINKFIRTYKVGK